MGFGRFGVLTPQSRRSPKTAEGRFESVAGEGVVVRLRSNLCGPWSRSALRQANLPSAARARRRLSRL
jgi:hypothetical protein